MKYLIMSLLVFFISGCFYSIDMSQGNPELSAAWVKTNVVKGKTSKDDLLKTLGPATSTQITADYIPRINSPGVTVEMPAAIKSRETWTWVARAQKPETPPNNKIKTPNIQPWLNYRTVFFTAYFDDNGVVTDYSVIES